MPSEIIDLDVLIPKPKKVKLDGTVYTLPAEIPVPLYLRLKHEQEEAAKDPEAERDGIEEVYAQCLELFRIHQPDIEELPVGMLQLLKLVPAIYGAGIEGASEGDEGPNPQKTRARTGSGNTRTRRKASGSSTS